MSGRTVGFILPGLGISGGIHIVLRWAGVLSRNGYVVHVLVPRERRLDPLPFIDEASACFSVLAIEDAKDIEFDLVFASWWETLARTHELRTRRVALFLQALESQFYGYGAAEQEQFEALLTSGIPVVTIAHWLADHLRESLGVPSELIQTVLNPLDKSLWRPVAPRIPKNGKLRFLVEGPSIDPRKNVRETLGLLEAAGAEHVWVGALVDRSWAGRHCIEVLEQVPYLEMPAVYASCDVLVKLSNAEGMFGPPLEMFATGGTAVAWEVPGSEEYMAHRHNCLLAPMNSLSAARGAIEQLQRDPALLRRLQAAARQTAERWPDWHDQEAQIVQAVESVPEVPREAFLRRIASYWQFRTMGPLAAGLVRPGTHRNPTAGKLPRAPVRPALLQRARSRLLSALRR